MSAAQNLELSLSQIVKCCQNSDIGKRLPNALYVHVSALCALSLELQQYEQRARVAFPTLSPVTLVKFHFDQRKISYLSYPDFDSNPHPALDKSVQVNLETLEVSQRDYRRVDNPPILHRKETFVKDNYPLYEQFTHLTRHEEALGLLNTSHVIGTYFDWQRRLGEKGLEIIGHFLACPIAAKGKPIVQIERHRAAMVRNDLSRPVKLALEANILTPETSFFDYGCGYGGDIQRLQEKGFSCLGWDPYYRPETPFTPADVVNLGYIINVIESPQERREALLKAWNLTQRVLIVAAQVLIRDRTVGQIAYGDGIITRRNTFQKYYEQEELKAYIDSVLGVNAIPVGIGIYFIFRNEEEAETFRTSRFRSRATTPRIRANSKRFEDYEELLTPLMNFITERGRLPIRTELAQEEAIKAEFGSFRRAFKVILQVTEAQEWEAIYQKRAEDLQLYLALSHFSGRPKSIKALSTPVQQDIKSLFSSYKQACLLADMMLLSLRDLDAIADICQESPIGKKLPGGLLVHLSALEALDPLLRLYEGCASRTIGRMESVTAIKFHTRKPQITYLYYPDFDTHPHPTLASSMQIDLRDLRVSYRNYDESNPPLLHQKEELLPLNTPGYEKFAKLTRQEEDWGLLDDPKAIRLRQGWLQCLEEHSTILDEKNYRLLRRKDVDPYKLKLLRSAVRTRQEKRRKEESQQPSL